MHLFGDGEADRWPDDPVDRAAAVAAWGLDPARAPSEEAVGRLAGGDPDPRVRAAALGALTRRDPDGTAPDAWRAALADPEASVRVRACEVAATLAGTSGRTSREAGEALVGALDDLEPLVAEAAAFALGELGPDVRGGAVPALVRTAGEHADPLVREAAVAALGSLGDPSGLPAVLAACTDKAAVRRRAVLALAAFDGPEVEAALQAALGDRDWQVRQAAEDLLGPDATGGKGGGA